MSPRTGRPRVEIPKDIRFSIRLDVETDAILQAYCDEHGITRAEAIRLGIQMLLEQK